MKDAVRNYFEEVYQEPELDRPNLDGIEFKCLDSMESESLVADFAYEEIKVVVWSCGNGKSSRPNGFNSNFFKECWSIVGKDVCDRVHEFFCNTELPKAIIASFITLIPKQDYPLGLADFHHISLISNIHKIISKLIAEMIKVLPSIIYMNAILPLSRVKGRLDGVLDANELIDWTKRNGRKVIMVKVDFQKAYDSVSWSFLDYMMRRLGFDEK